jgi:UDP-N-acetylmuramoyl-L-alanyl-D-glutamate--2,6-diaminopimelate ligase
MGVKETMTDLRTLLSSLLGEQSRDREGAEAFAGLDGAVPDAPSIPVTGVFDDSRDVTPGSVFVAVAGAKANGAAFVADAVARGAVAVVMEADPPQPGAAVPRDQSRAREEAVSAVMIHPKPEAAGPDPLVVRVPEAREALARLAAAYYGLARIQAEGELRVVGITGTNGKSTTAYMIREMLRAAGKPAAMFGTIEYDLVGRKVPADLTTPGAVALTRHLVEAHAAGARHAVMEVSSHSLDQRRADGIRFAVGVFTNLTQDHLDYHKTREQYLAAKRRLFEGLDAEATAVVNADDPASDEIVAGCRARVVRFGLRPTADVRARIVEEGSLGSRFVLHHASGEFEVHTPLVGRHNVANALGAAAAAMALGVGEEAVRRGLAGLVNVPGRLQRVDAGSLGFGVFVDYAHTDDALNNVLRAMRPLTRGRLWCVFGCGGDRDRTKRPLMAQAVARGADAFIITSDNPRTEDPLAIIADIERGLTEADRRRGEMVPDRAAAIARAVGRLERGDVLLIAGKGHENYQIFGTEKVHFDDVEAAAAAIAGRQAVRCGC